jgi:hypothetical protein
VRLVRARDTDLDLVYEAGKRKEAGGRLKYYGVGVCFSRRQQSLHLAATIKFFPWGVFHSRRDKESKSLAVRY